MSNIANEVLAIAEEYGINIPHVNADGTINADVAAEELVQAQEEYLSLVMRYSEAQYNNNITPEVTRNVNQARDILYNAQRLVYREFTANTLYRGGVAVGAFPELAEPRAYPDVSPKKSYPQWFAEYQGASADVIAMFSWYPEHEAIRNEKGLGDGGASAAAVTVPLWAVAVLTVLAVIGITIAISSGGEIARSTTAVRGLARATEDALERRRTIFDECRASGADEASCIERAERLAPTPNGEAFCEAAGGCGDSNLAMKVGIGIAVLGAGYLALRYFGNYAGSKGTADGMRGLRGPKRLNRLDDPYPSNYFLEV